MGLLGCRGGGDLGEHPSEGQGLTPVGGRWLGGGWLLKSVGGHSVDSQAQAYGGEAGGMGMAQLC